MKIITPLFLNIGGANQNALEAAIAPNGETNLTCLVEQVKERTGVVSHHLIPLQQVARKYNCVIGIRPVDKLATQLIEAGYPTKDFKIKAKSASWGPQAGFIPKDQSISKLENNSELTAKYQAQIQECLQKGDAVTVPLTLTLERCDFLLQAGIISHLSYENSRGECHFSAKAPSGKIYHFTASRPTEGQDLFQIYHQHALIEVLAPREGAKALTADYDLLVIGPHMRDFGPLDNRPISDVSHQVLLKRIRHYKAIPSNVVLLNEILNKNSFYRKEDLNMGNISQRVRELIPIINQALVGNGEAVFHHNDDAGSPAADPKTNYPATFVLPTKLGTFDEICVIENKEQLINLIQQAKDSGYHIPLNPLWEPEVTSTRRLSFLNAKRELEKLMPLHPQAQYQSDQ